MFILPQSLLRTCQGVPGSTIDEEVADTTTIAVFPAPRFVLVTQIHDNADPNTPIVVVTAPSLLRGIPRTSSWYTTNAQR